MFYMVYRTPTIINHSLLITAHIVQDQSILEEFKHFQLQSLLQKIQHLGLYPLIPQIQEFGLKHIHIQRYQLTEVLVVIIDYILISVLLY